MENENRFRHELKYLISEREMDSCIGRIREFARPDPHAKDGRYFTFNEALKAGNTLTRAQGLALYEARYAANINDILDLIGGDRIRGWIWTCEEDSDPRYSAAYACFVYLYNGNATRIKNG